MSNYNNYERDQANITSEFDKYLEKEEKTLTSNFDDRIFMTFGEKYRTRIVKDYHELYLKASGLNFDLKIMLIIDYKTYLLVFVFTIKFMISIKLLERKRDLLMIL